MNRRAFLKTAAAVFIGIKVRPTLAFSPQDAGTPQFRTANARWQAAYDRALVVLANNVRVLPRYDKPVLTEGSSYNGIWMECGPLEALAYRQFRPDVARNSHLIFFALQRTDGQFPAANKVNGIGFGQIQMVVPIAATAWELARASGDDELLNVAYKACVRWDDWLVRYRNRRGTGLIEGVCAYDTGNDNSPRWAGIPNQCPNRDAKNYPAISGLPRLCPDLSATVYGARIALAEMARAIGKSAEADRWTESAQKIRALILSRLYVAEDAAFYDLDTQGRFVRIRSEIITRVCCEHVPDQKLFDDLWTRQIHNANAFWPRFPLPSVAIDDAHFVRPIPRNSWGGASQALTALRAGRWFDHYERSAEFAVLMDRWCQAIQDDMTFRQQIDPRSGVFTQQNAPNYSPCALVMVDYTWRLAGVRQERNSLHWNVRPGHPAAQSANFLMRTDDGGNAEMRYDAHGVDLSLGGVSLGRIEGGAVRLVTNKKGEAQALIGISEQTQNIAIRLAGQKPRQVTVAANARIAL